MRSLGSGELAKQGIKVKDPDIGLERESVQHSNRASRRPEREKGSRPVKGRTCDGSLPDPPPVRLQRVPNAMRDERSRHEG